MGRLAVLKDGGSSGDGTTRFLYDGDELIAAYDAGGNMLDRYVHGAEVDDPVVWYEGSGVSSPKYLFPDERGSIVAVANSSGSLLHKNKYDEYGVPFSTNGGLGVTYGRFAYTGQIWLPELGMYHYKARLYSPTLGRFLQTDPIGYDDQVNLYAYVGNDPVNMVDPSGMVGGPDDWFEHVKDGIHELGEGVVDVGNHIADIATNTAYSGAGLAIDGASIAVDAALPDAWYSPETFGGDLIPSGQSPNSDDLDLAADMGGEPSMKFSEGPQNEFDVVSATMIGQTTRQKGTRGQFRSQADRTMQAARDTGRSVRYHFPNGPTRQQSRELTKRAARYRVQLVITAGEF